MRFNVNQHDSTRILASWFTEIHVVSTWFSQYLRNLNQVESTRIKLVQLARQFLGRSFSWTVKNWILCEICVIWNELQIFVDNYSLLQFMWNIPYRHKAATLALSLESFFLLSSTTKVEIDIISYLCSKHVGEMICSDIEVKSGKKFEDAKLILKMVLFFNRWINNNG